MGQVAERHTDNCGCRGGDSAERSQARRLRRRHPPLLEVGIIETDDQDYVIHAMTARDKYLAMLDTSGGEQT